jgi:hypothetical protein
MWHGEKERGSRNQIESLQIGGMGRRAEKKYPWIRGDASLVPYT